MSTLSPTTQLKDEYKHEQVPLSGVGGNEVAADQSLPVAGQAKVPEAVVTSLVWAEVGEIELNCDFKLE